jgi:hypothetical protein
MPKKETKVQEEKQDEGEPKISSHFLKVDHELRPEGTHFGAEAGATAPVTELHK